MSASASLESAAAEERARGWLGALSRIVARVSWARLESWGAVLGFLAGSVLRIRRRAVDAAMQRAGIAREHASAMYAALGTGVFELLWLAGTRDQSGAVATVELPEIPPSCILAASHTSNWELVAAGVNAKVPLSIVAKRITSGAFHVFINHLRQRIGLEVIEPEGALRVAKRALDRGRVVAMPIDQVPGREGLVMPFLGADAFCDRAPAALAYRAKVPLLVIATRREGRRHVMELLARLEPSGDRSWIDMATQTANRELERFVRAHPSAWMWLHRRWRAPLLAGKSQRD